MRKQSEEICQSKTHECGKCQIPNPMNTGNKRQALLGFSIILSPKYQKSIINKFGKTEGKQKLECEYNRVKGILEKDYQIYPKAKFRLK